jgi:hypothetical protein
MKIAIHHHHLHKIHAGITTVGTVIMVVATFVYVGINGGFGSQRSNIGEAATCTVNSLLVNSCRPWLGAAVGGYSMVASDSTSQFNFANKRLNDPNVLNNPGANVTLTKDLDIIHVYKTNNNTSFTSTDNTFMAQPGTYLYINYKPDTSGWASSTGGNATINARIDALADSFKAKPQYKFFLALFHEPENDVSSGNCTANANGASAGSPTDYVNMWHNVRSRFDAKGVNNVVWVMNYMGYANWNCLVPMLWPGNSYVDWITYDAYGSGTGAGANFTQNIADFYGYLSSNSDATHAYTSKVWGLAEHGYSNANGVSTHQKAIDYWNQATAAIQNNTFPLLKAYMVFDTSTNGTSQVGVDFAGAVSVPEQTAYNAFAQAIFDKEGSEVGDTTNPVVSITSPANGATLSGTITLGINASDNTAVTRVDSYWDSTNLIRSASSQNGYGWGAAWDTLAVGNGAHTLTVIAYDAAGNSASTQIAVTVQNASTPPVDDTGESTGPPPPVTVIDSTTGDEIVDAQTSDELTVGNLITLDTSTVTSAEVADTIERVEFYVNGELWETVYDPPFALSTTALGAGEYAIMQRTFYTDGTMTETTKTVTLVAANTFADTVDQGADEQLEQAGSSPLLLYGAMTGLALLAIVVLAMTGRGRRLTDRMILYIASFRRPNETHGYSPPPPPSSELPSPLTPGDIIRPKSKK